MGELIPNRQLFRFEIPLRRRRRPPVIDGDLGDWSEEFRMPAICRLDGREPYASMYIAWDERGLYLACRVDGKQEPPECDPQSFWKGDNVRLCTDMRDARDIKRATRFCQQFYFLPTGGGRAGREPVAGAAPIQRAREDAPPVAPGRIAVAAVVTRSGYTLEGHIPADCLSGWDPSDHRRIGLYYIIEDREKGQQYLTVGDALQWYVDPSTWAAAVLTD